jgi:hypothetical protein
VIKRWDIGHPGVGLIVKFEQDPVTSRIDCHEVSLALKVAFQEDSPCAVKNQNQTPLRAFE